MSSKWPLVQLGELTTNFDAKRRPVKKADRTAGPFPYYGASGIVDHVHGHLFDGDYLLIGEDGENMRTRQTPIAFMAKGKFWVNNHAHIVQGNARALTRFLCYALAATDISAFLTGAVMPKLTQGNLNKISVPCLPLADQERVVKLLGALDDAIDTLRAENAALTGVARHVFRSWFVNYEPVHAKVAGTPLEGMPEHVNTAFPDTFADSGVGPIPTGWEVTTFGESFDIKGGGTPSTSTAEYWENGTHWWATPHDMSGLTSSVLHRTGRKITTAGVNKISSKVLPVNTTLMSSRAPVGYLAVARVPVSVNQGFIAIPPVEGIPAGFVLELLASKMDEIEGKAGGTTFAEISKTQFRPIKWVRPSPAALQAYGAVVDPIYAAIHGNCVLQDSLAELRDHLLPRMVAGTMPLLESAEAVASLQELAAVA